MGEAGKGAHKRAKRGETAEAVWRTLRKEGPMTAPGVAEAAGLGASAAAAGLARLMDEGRVRKAGSGPNPDFVPGRRGKRSLNLYAAVEPGPEEEGEPAELHVRALRGRSELELAVAGMCRLGASEVAGGGGTSEVSCS